MSVLTAVSVLDHDPDLAEDLGREELARAREHAIARVTRYPKGPWSVSPGDFDRAGSLGLLVVDGLMVRTVTVGERTCAELLGPGDVTQPWLLAGPDSSVDTDVNWRVPQTVRLAVLDRAFATRLARWPEISAAIARRIMLRVHWLSFHLAVCHMRRVDDRLLLVLWHFADRWGRVTPEGVEIAVPLSHNLLASVVGAHRPSVTVAVHQLIEAGQLEPRGRSRWLLRGEPPAELTALHEQAARHRTSAPERLKAMRHD